MEVQRGRNRNYNWGVCVRRAIYSALTVKYYTVVPFVRRQLVSSVPFVTAHAETNLSEWKIWWQQDEHIRHIELTMWLYRHQWCAKECFLCFIWEWRSNLFLYVELWQVFQKYFVLYHHGKTCPVRFWGISYLLLVCKEKKEKIWKCKLSAFFATGSCKTLLALSVNGGIDNTSQHGCNKM